MPHQGQVQVQTSYKQEDRYEVKLGDCILESYNIIKEIGSGMKIGLSLIV